MRKNICSLTVASYKNIDITQMTVHHIIKIKNSFYYLIDMMNKQAIFLQNDNTKYHYISTASYR